MLGKGGCEALFRQIFFGKSLERKINMKTFMFYDVIFTRL